MRSRLILASLGLAVLAFGAIALRAQEPAPAPKGQEAAQVREDIAAAEQQIARQFAEFEQLLLRLKQRLERSPKKEDRARADVLARVLEESRGLGVQVKFERLQDFLRKSRINDVGEAKKLRMDTERIAEDLRALLDRLREDPRGRKVQEEIAKLKEIIKDLEKNIYQQKEVQGRTDLGKTDAKELQQNQRQVSKKTEDILAKLDKLLGKDGKGGQGGEGKQQPGAPKDGPKGEGKAGESKGEGKTGEQARGESKAGGEGSKDAKGEAKSGQESGGKKGGEGQEGEAGKKGGQGAEGQAKEKGSKGGEAGQGQAKEKGGQAGEKGSQGGAKGAGEKKGGDKSGQAGAKGSQGGKKGGEAGQKGGQGQAKSGGEGGKKGGQAGAKGSQGGQKGGQQGAQKGGEQKQQQAGKHGETKTGEKGDAQAKNDGSKEGGQQGGQKGGQQASAKGSKGGQQGGQQGGEQGGQKGGEQGGEQGGDKQGNQKEKDQIASSKKRVQEGNYQQKGAEEALKKPNNKVASDKQGKAVEELEKAKERLERLLRQLREEEMERVLAQLQARCEKMLAMQMAVLAGTEATHKGVEATSNKKATRAHQQEALKLSDTEKEIISEANKAIEMLEAEGSAVAFPEVFQQVREDMKHVQRRLEITDVGQITQGIERDIIDTLKEMIEALKKARQENEASKGEPKEGKQGNPADQKLLDQIAELKMIRSLQLRVNARTKLYGRQYQEREGEQTANPTIQRELNNLAERQERIFEVTNRIAKGDNR